jgi:hypothetical protein
MRVNAPPVPENLLRRRLINSPGRGGANTPTPGLSPIEGERGNKETP